MSISVLALSNYGTKSFFLYFLKSSTSFFLDLHLTVFQREMIMKDRQLTFRFKIENKDESTD